MQFASPFWLLLLLPVVYLWYRGHKYSSAQSKYLSSSNIGALQLKDFNWRLLVRPYVGVLRYLALALMVVALARPQKVQVEEKVTGDGVDIVLSMDVSPSMLSRDFSPDRLAVAKAVASDFVKNRKHDRMGLVSFAAEAITECPLTTDQTVMIRGIDLLSVGKLENGTAIGMGLATAVNRLRHSEVKSRVVILLTDGENNAGYISPEKAIELAKTMNIKVYVIGIGSSGIAMSPSSQNFDGTYNFSPRSMEFDETLLQTIASETQGKYYRARNAKELEEIYKEINALEKSEVEVTVFKKYRELFYIFSGVALAFLLLEMLFRWVVLREI